MAESLGSVYQTGQQVEKTGTYTVVGVNVITVEKQESAVRDLNAGDIFPSYEGWDVCWRLVTLVQKPQNYLSKR